MQVSSWSHTRSENIKEQRKVHIRYFQRLVSRCKGWNKWMVGSQVLSAGLVGTWSVVLCIGLRSSLGLLWWPLIQRVSRYERLGERGWEVLEGRNWNDIKYSLFRRSPQDLFLYVFGQRWGRLMAGSQYVINTIVRNSLLYIWTCSTILELICGLSWYLDVIVEHVSRLW